MNSILSCLGPLSPGTISALSDVMGRRRACFFGRAREKGSRQNRNGIDGTQVHKSLKDGTKRRYKDAARLCSSMSSAPASFLGLHPPFPHLHPALLMLSPLTLLPFNSFCVGYDKNSNDDAYDLETLKDFIQEVAYGMDGVEGEDDPPSLKSVKQAWKDLQLSFAGNMIPSLVTLHFRSQMYAVCPWPLLFSSAPERMLIRLNTALWEKLGLPFYK